MSTIQKSSYEKFKLGAIVSFKTGKLNSNASTPSGDYPFFTCSQETFRTDTYSFDTEAVLLGGNNANGIYPLKYYKGKFDAYQRTYIIRSIDENKLVNSYLYFALRPQLDLLRSISTGAATKFLTLTILNEIELKLPPLPTQRKIASILSAYDDLIENNTRRIKILEEMAQMIYREWFVKFRFPGANVETSRRGVSNPINETCHRHVSTNMVDSAMGRIPEGWEVQKVTEAIEINPRTSVPRDGEKPFVPMGSLSTNSMLISDIEHRTGNSGSKFKNGDTLFARITPCLENGKTAFVQFLPTDNASAFGSTEFIVLRSKTLCPEYVYLMARSDEFRNNAIKSMSGATGRQRVNEKCFEQFFIAQPDGLTLQCFSEQISPMFKGIHNLAKKNISLRQTRDLLLPRLISGEVDVEGLEILTE